MDSVARVCSDLAWLDTDSEGLDALLRDSFHPGYRCGAAERAFELDVLRKVKNLIERVPSLCPNTRYVEEGHIRQEEEPFLSYREHREVFLYYSEFYGDSDVNFALIYKGQLYFELAGLAVWVDKRMGTKNGYWRRGLDKLRKLSCVTYSLFVEGEPPGCIWVRTRGVPRRGNDKRVFKSQFVSPLVVFIICQRFIRNKSRVIDPDRKKHMVDLFDILNQKYGVYGDSPQREKISLSLERLDDTDPETSPPGVLERSGPFRWTYLHRDYSWPLLEPRRRTPIIPPAPRPPPGKRDAQRMKKMSSFRDDFVVLSDYNRFLSQYLHREYGSDALLNAEREVTETMFEKYGEEAVKRAIYSSNLVLQEDLEDNFVTDTSYHGSDDEESQVDDLSESLEGEFVWDESGLTEFLSSGEEFEDLSESFNSGDEESAEPSLSGIDKFQQGDRMVVPETP